MEMSSDTNLRSVTTRVTVNDEHSVVNTNTEPMQMYCVTQLASSQIHDCGKLMPKANSVGGVWPAMFRCSQMLLYSKKKPGSGSRCYGKNKNVMK